MITCAKDYHQLDIVTSPAVVIKSSKVLWPTAGPTVSTVHYTFASLLMAFCPLLEVVNANSLSTN